MLVYFTRAAKYFVRLCVICAVLLAVLYATGSAAVPLSELSYVLLHTWRGALLAVAAVAVSLAYPRFGFAERLVAGDFDALRGDVAEVMAALGMHAVSQTADSVTFRPAGLLRRVRLLFDDEVRVSRCGGGVIICGLRRTVLRAASHLEARAGGE